MMIIRNHHLDHLCTVDAADDVARSVSESLGITRSVLLFITRNGVPEDIGAPEGPVTDNLISGFYPWRS